MPLADASRSRGAICVAQPAREGTRWIADTCHPHNSPPLLRAQVRRQPVPAWADWPDGQLFLGQRGPLTERGIREIVAQLGQAAKLDPAAYGLGRPPASLPAVQALLGHADIATTALYTCASPADLARLLGEPSDVYVALGGIAYNYVADNYIALFIQFIAQAGEAGIEAIDAAARRILRTGHDQETITALEQAIDRPEHHALIRAAGAEAIVMLKNDRGIQPLDDIELTSITIIGPNAKTAQIIGGGSAQVNAHYAVTMPWLDKVAAVIQPGTLSAFAQL